MKPDHQIEQYALAIFGAVSGLVDAENEDRRFDLEKVDGTKFFTAFMLSFCLMYERLTGNEINLAEGLTILMRLTIQHLLENARD